jgi:SAM-dependent methyltransferase
MRNKDKWVPSKYVYKKHKLIASRNPSEVAITDRLLADSVASLYDANIPQFARGRLVDLGCGKVPLFEAYRNYITDNVCVDWEHTLHKNEYLDYVCDLTQELPFSDGEFDTVILSDVLEHVPQPEKVWQEMSRILSPGGVALINVPFYFRLHEVPYDYYRYTEYALRRFADLTSFRILLLRPVGGTPEILADLLARHVQFVPLLGKSLVIAVQSVTGVFVKSALGRRISEKTGRIFPLGYFLVAEKISTSPKK